MSGTISAPLPACSNSTGLSKDLMAVCDNDFEILHKEDLPDIFADMIQRHKKHVQGMRQRWNSTSETTTKPPRN